MFSSIEGSYEISLIFMSTIQAKDVTVDIFTNFDTFYKYSQSHFRNVFTKTKSSKRMSESGIDLQQVIGKGAFGMVAVGFKGKEVVAVKIFNKKHLYRNRQIQRTIYEKQMLSSLIHPNILQFLGSYKDNSHLYMVMGIVPGGELYEHLKAKECFTEEESKQISAQLVLAFDFLHRINVAHRDLKAENVLVGANGYVKLSDMGFTKFLSDRAFTVCGTPEYMAPEILTRGGYLKSVDLWALGVLLYELNKGTTPFLAKDVNKISLKAASGKFSIPTSFSADLVDLITGLLRVNPLERYGCGKNGLDFLKQHRFYKDLDWWELFQQKIPMLFKPRLHDNFDFSNFNTSPLMIKEDSSDPLKAYFKNF